MRAVIQDHREAPIPEPDRLMLDYVVKLTREPWRVVAADIGRLRDVGFDDTAIHDIVQATALLNYYNRLADGLGIDPEPEHPPTDR